MDTDFFARLRGHTKHSNLAESIRDSLRWLLNSRRGFLPHLQDYGIRDLADIHNQEMREELKEDIRNTILKYEPRIKDLKIEEIEQRDEALKNFYVVYKLRVELQEVLGSSLTLIYGIDFGGKACNVD